MCIIIYSPEGVELPRRLTIQDSFDNNPDGAGYMFRANGKIMVRKGFMTAQALLSDIDMIGKKFDLRAADVVIHCRIGTSRAKDAGRCHPFPITNKIDHLTALKIVCDAALAHNGIITRLERPNADHSDTMYLVKQLYSLGLEHGMEAIVPSDGKIVIMTPTRTILFGTFIQHERILYSNSTYYYYTRWRKGDNIWSGCVDTVESVGIRKSARKNKKLTTTPQEEGHKKPEEQTKDGGCALSHRLKDEPIKIPDKKALLPGEIPEPIWFPHNNEGKPCKDKVCIDCQDMAKCVSLEHYRLELDKYVRQFASSSFYDL